MVVKKLERMSVKGKVYEHGGWFYEEQHYGISQKERPNDLMSLGLIPCRESVCLYLPWAQISDS